MGQKPGEHGYKGFFPVDGLGWKDTLPCRGLKAWNDIASGLVWTDLGTTVPAVPAGAVELTDSYHESVMKLKTAFKRGTTTFTQAEWDANFKFSASGVEFIVLLQNYIKSGDKYYRAETQQLNPPDVCTPWLNNNPHGYWTYPRPDLNHNFAFSTRFTRGFKYIASKMSGDFLRYDGDDDVWGYLHSEEDSRYIVPHKVVDIGGIHPQLDDAFWLGSAPGGSKYPGLNLQDGAFYTITLFHAERQLYQSNFVMYMPMTECLCCDDENHDNCWGVYDSRFPRECRANPYKSSCDGHSFVYESDTAMVSAASTLPNGVTTGSMEHAICKTCKTECFGTAAGASCTVCPECEGQGSGADAKCPSTE